MEREKQQEIADYLNGTSKSEHDAAEAFGVSSDEVLDAVVECGVECCNECGWWFDCGELHEDATGTGFVCEDCDPDAEDS